MYDHVRHNNDCSRTTWYVREFSGTNLTHTGHVRIDPSASIKDTSNLSDERHDYIHKLSSLGVAPSTIASFLDSIDSGDGSYKSRDISNIAVRHKVVSNKAMGITHDMSTAERCMAFLDRYVYHIRCYFTPFQFLLTDSYVNFIQSTNNIHLDLWWSRSRCNASSSA